MHAPIELKESATHGLVQILKSVGWDEVEFIRSLSLREFREVPTVSEPVSVAI